MIDGRDGIIKERNDEINKINDIKEKEENKNDIYINLVHSSSFRTPKNVELYNSFRGKKIIEYWL